MALRIALPKEPEHAVDARSTNADESDSISHLIAVVRGTRNPNAVLARNNVIATEILDAARESARQEDEFGRHGRTLNGRRVRN